MPADHDLIKQLSTMGSALISAQMASPEGPSQDTGFDPWMFGYCYGFVDAVSQAGGLTNVKDFLLLMTVTFNEIAKGNGELELGAQLVEEALKKQMEPSFQEGVMQGGADFMAYRQDQTAIPFGLKHHQAGPSPA
jgi:hypothetical protein